MDFTPKELVEEFKKMESGDFGFFIFAICGSVCPGILAIWMAHDLWG
jgi:hypothetical protein